MDTFDFGWPVAQDGYEWARARDAKTGSFTEILHARPSTRAGRTYPVLSSTPQLYTEFERLGRQPTRDNVATFAAKYGMLTVGQPYALDGKVVAGETFGTWTSEATRMAVAIRLWRAYKNDNFKVLAKYITWAADGVKFHPPEYRESKVPFMWIAHRRTTAEIIERFEKGDLKGPAIFQIRTMIDEQLKGHVSLRSLWNPAAPPRSLPVEQKLRPDGLLSAMWLQFSQAFHGNVEIRECTTCERWYEARPGRGAHSKEFCNQACRFKAYRQRQAQAKRLATKGKSPAEIAVEIGSTPAVVRGWLKKKKENKR